MNLSRFYFLLQSLVTVKYAVELDTGRVGVIRGLSSLVSLFCLPPTAFFPLIIEKLFISKIYRLQELR